MHAISLFSGVGGIDLGLKSLCRTVLYCEIEPGCQRVLQARMSSGELPQAPLHADVTTLSKQALQDYLGDTHVDMLFGGFPCWLSTPYLLLFHVEEKGLKCMCVAGQDLSTAGRRLGMDGKRSVLFWHIIRIAEELPKKPEWIFLENVPGIRQLALRQVAGALSDAGYDVRWTTLRVSAIGGHHRRERWFGLARLRPPAPVADTSGPPREPDAVPELQQPADGCIQQGVQGLACGPAYQTGFWLCEPGVDRMADGVSPKVDRCRLRRNHMLGNAVCPPQALFAFRVLAGLAPYPAKPPAPKRGALPGPHKPVEESSVDD